jgi:hypothetical protein
VSQSEHRSLRSLILTGPVDDALALFDEEAFDAGLDDLALLHRDPRAERSRLITRRLLAAAVARWWDPSDPEFLRAQIILSRFGDRHQAQLAAADGWTELAAGGASVDEILGVRIATVSEERAAEAALVHGATVVAIGSVVMTVTASSTQRSEVARWCGKLASAQIKLLEAP